MEHKIRSRISASFIYFGRNSNVHGLKYIAEAHRPWISKMFWITSMLICSWGFILILKGTLKSFSQDILSFTPDTNRLTWNTAFPSITVCEKYLHFQTLKKLNKYYPDMMEKVDSFDYKKMLTELFFTDTNCKLCNDGCGPGINCSMDLREMAEKVREPCSGLIFDCAWQGKPLDCCQYFLPIDSEFGLCYSFNTMQSRLTGTVPLFRNNRTTGPGNLSFYVHKRLLVYVHEIYDVPWSKTELDMRFEVNDDDIDFRFGVLEMSNDHLVRDIGLDIRKCRFPNEIVESEFGKSFRFHGYAACMTTCKTEILFKYCQCVHHLRDKMFSDITCNFTGFICLSLFDAEKYAMFAEEVEVSCKHCYPSCEEVEFTKIYINEYETEEDNSRVDIKMEHLPNMQYHRTVGRTHLDLVVSVGGLAGLFFGASLLTLVEAIYLIIRA